MLPALNPTFTGTRKVTEQLSLILCLYIQGSVHIGITMLLLPINSSLK